jgi:hypothetical protein
MAAAGMWNHKMSWASTLPVNSAFQNHLAINKLAFTVITV